MTLSISVQFASHAAHLPKRAQVRRWANAAYALGASHDATVTIRYVDNAEARELNRNFRGKDYATNVLTFADALPDLELFHAKRESASKKDKRVSTHVHADIAICAPVIAQEAKAQRKSLRAHHAHMVVHGMLHALGFDHERETDASEMEALEARVLRRFRINNPYE